MTWCSLIKKTCNIWKVGLLKKNHFRLCCYRKYSTPSHHHGVDDDYFPLTAQQRGVFFFLFLPNPDPEPWVWILCFSLFILITSDCTCNSLIAFTLKLLVIKGSQSFFYGACAGCTPSETHSRLRQHAPLNGRLLRNCLFTNEQCVPVRRSSSSESALSREESAAASRHFWWEEIKHWNSITGSAGSECKHRIWKEADLSSG